MFRSFTGSKAQYHDLTLLVISEFNEWKVLAYAPGVTIHGQRQFAEDKAKEHAAAIAKSYYDDFKHAGLPQVTELLWTQTTPEDWMAWR